MLLSDGRVLIVGGVVTIEVYDPNTGSFSLAGGMRENRVSATATLLQNGKALIAGGAILVPGVSVDTTTSAELYDPATRTSVLTGSLRTARESHTATLLSNGKVLVAGGSGPNGDLPSAELYDPATNTFSATGSMSSARRTHRATLLQSGKVLIAGGVGTGFITTGELFQ
jgi:hypothetical protein